MLFTFDGVLRLRFIRIWKLKGGFYCSFGNFENDLDTWGKVGMTGVKSGMGNEGGPAGMIRMKTIDCTLQLGIYPITNDVSQ